MEHGLPARRQRNRNARMAGKMPALQRSENCEKMEVEARTKTERSEKQFPMRIIAPLSETELG
jgi:hypothetical protein